MTSEEIKAVPLIIEQHNVAERTNAVIQATAALEANVWLKEIALQFALHNEREAYRDRGQVMQKESL